MLVILTLKISVAVACPISTGVFTAVASTVKSSGTLNAGFVVSTTVIFCTPVEALPFASVAVQITVVSPSGYADGALLSIVTL
ncbi:hypothetical protein D3C73_873730 [compost metagenome]